MKNWKILLGLLCLLAVTPCWAGPKEKKKIVLVLGSGGSRALAHVGVIEELETLGIVPDVIVGCSSGSIVGALYAYSKDIGKVKELLIDMKYDDLVDLSLFQKCAFSTPKKLEKFLEKNLPANDFESLQIPFVAVATDIHKGEPVYFKEGSLHSAIMASAALPGLFPPHEFEGKTYIDGGVCDPLPIGYAKTCDNDCMVIASDISSSLDGFDISSLPEVVRKSFEIIYHRLAHFEKQKADFILEMNFTDVSSPIDDGNNQLLYERGKQVVRDHYEELAAKC